MMRNILKIIAIICLGLVLGYCIRGLWIKGVVIEKKARLLSEYLDQSFSRLGLSPEDISRHFYEERRCGIKKFVHTTKIFNLPQKISTDKFYQAILDAVKESKAHLLEKTNFDIGEYSISIFVLGRRSISTHLLVGVKGKAPEPPEGSERPVKDKRPKTSALPLAGISKGVAERSKVAIIIDDMGYNTKALNYVSEIKVPLTLAVLPQLPFSQRVAQEGHIMGHEIILHLPLEPEEEIECLGPGAILLEAGPEKIENILDKNLRTVPHCRGLNNHAGSRFTKDTQKMKVLLEAMKKRDLFFVDSLVTPESCGFSLAIELDVPTASRDIFLDNIKEEEYILNQLKELIVISHRTGKAIGIGHPSPITLQVLKKNLHLFAEDVEFVHVSQLLR